MKREILFTLFILATISVNFVSAGGVGISPAYYKVFFEPGLEKSFGFHAFNSDPEKGVNIFLTGDLAEYAELSDSYMKERGGFSVSLKLPEEIEKPGTHHLYVGVIEAQEEIDSGIGGIAAVQSRIDILVPYPGKYAESTFKINNINEGEEIEYELTTENFGSQNLSINSTIEIYKKNSSEKLLTEIIKKSTLKPKETLSVRGTINTKDLPPGEYHAFATIDWGEIDEINQSFRIGEFLVEIVDYDYQFEEEKINPFNIKIANKWNLKIDQVFANVDITDEGTLVGSFKTASVDTRPWEIKNITGYFDTSNLETKRYTASITLSYGDRITNKLVAIYINESPKKRYTKYIILASIIAIIIIAAFAYLIIKIIKLKKQNAKKK